MKWHGRPAREITRKMRMPQQQDTRKLERDLRVPSRLEVLRFLSEYLSDWRSATSISP
jgi:hypothetical protein